MTRIDIISGFLGAGKTTLIKKLLGDALKGQQVVLIENEFGEIGIDGGFLKDAGIEIREMNSGCICCSLVGDFGAALKDVITKYHPDRIIIEPSGVGNSPTSSSCRRCRKRSRRSPEFRNNRSRCYEMQNVSQKLRRILRESGKERRNHHPEPYR